MNEAPIYAVTVHYNRLQDTIACIKSLQEQTYPNLRIICVDNASKDGGAEAIRRNFPEVIQILNPENLGATGGYNAGLEYAVSQNADYIYLVNNDTITQPDAIEILARAIFPENVGVVSPLIYYFDYPDVIWSSGGNISKLTLDILEDKENHAQIIERDILTACAMLFRRSALQKAGYFDNTYFWYYDDLDISLRIKKQGYKLLVARDAIVFHKVSRSSGGSDSPVERFFMGRGSMIYYSKHASIWQWLFIVPKRCLSIVKTTFRLLRAKQAPSAKAYLRGIIAGLYLVITGKESSLTKIYRI